MRRAWLDLGGQRHLLVFSGRVAQELEETKNMPVQQYLETVLAADQPKFSEYLFLTGLMLRAGDLYAKKNGMPNAPCPTADELPDVIDIMDDLPRIAEALTEVITGTRNVQAKEPRGKNAEGAPADAGRSA